MVALPFCMRTVVAVLVSLSGSADSSTPLACANTGERTMTTENGLQAPRKTLAEQIDRLDGVLDRMCVSPLGFT